MGTEYSVDVCRELQSMVRSMDLHRPMRITRYDPGQELVYDVTGVAQPGTASVRLVVEDFVGGGFAGQVYRVKIADIESCQPQIGPNNQQDTTKDKPHVLGGLEVGRIYAMKILVPPSCFSRLFRNLLYRIGFQGPFQLQVNPAAARASALWQKFIRRASRIRFGDENVVADVYATFVDGALGSCGELGEWVDGRTWRLEVDDRLDFLKRWRRGKPVDNQRLGSPEYRAKRRFMRDFVALAHDVGWHEFARQYEWSTCKSQPNCLKRQGTDDDPAAGLVAVDFKAGLALLPLLPMSPGDFKLIAKGIARGSLVQFDRGDLNKLDAFVQTHSPDFVDMNSMLEELKEAEQVYRESIPDISHNHLRLFCSGRLWSTILDSSVTGWKVRDLLDERWEKRLRASAVQKLLFLLLGLIPFLGTFCRKIWGRPDWRRHYASVLTSWGYLRRAVRARIAEKVIIWHRAGRVDAERAGKIADSIWRFLCHLPFSALPVGLHRLLTDRCYARQRLAYYFVRPVRLYFNAAMREQWLRDMVTDGQRKHILSSEDAQTILSRIDEPFIQKYLKSLAVHVCTLPVTQVVSVIVASVYVKMHPELTWQQATVAAGTILVAFQLTPISPGSLVRGLYVLYLVIRERNFKDYNIAVILGFFKYVGYLAFPIQMAYRYPALARFMAAHWATGAVHVVPVFGERGALLEHGIFNLFYNWPLTVRRRMRKRTELRKSLQPRYWHIGICAGATAMLFGLVDFVYIAHFSKLPALKDIWLLVLVLPLICGSVATLACGGATFGKRVAAAAVCGILAGLLYSVLSAWLSRNTEVLAHNMLASSVWRVFIFAVLASIGAILTELKLPDPDLR